MATKTISDVREIMRRVVGEQDGNDPDATADILLDYVVNFYNLIMGQDIKSFDLFENYSFSTVIDDDTYTFDDIGYTNLMPPAYITDSDNNDSPLAWFQNQEDFYSLHPINNTDETSGKPFDLLFFDNTILLRPKPDAVYTVTIQGYKEFAVDESNDAIAADYMLRYIAYGAALDYFADFGNVEDYMKYEPIFKRYRALVLARTATQLGTQRAKQAL